MNITKTYVMDVWLSFCFFKYLFYIMPILQTVNNSNVRKPVYPSVETCSMCETRETVLQQAHRYYHVWVLYIWWKVDIPICISIVAILSQDECVFLLLFFNPLSVTGNWLKNIVTFDCCFNQIINPYLYGLL